LTTLLSFDEGGEQMIDIREFGLRRPSVPCRCLSRADASAGLGRADDVSGELVLLDWASGSEQDMIRALEEGFTKHIRASRSKKSI
jgi:hypothetical protein